MSELVKRSITGFFIVAITISAIYFSPYSCLTLLCLINAGGIYEFIGLNPTGISKIIRIQIAVALTLWLGFVGVSTILNWNTSLAFVSLPVLLAFLTTILLFQKIPADQVSRGARSLFSVAAYITLPLGMGCLFFFEETKYAILMLIPVILIWTNDVGAYLIGSRWGKRKISPAISPGKSMEGTVGGLVLCLTIAFVLTLIWSDIKPAYIWFLGALVPFFALAGDLYKSSLKRAAGVKDSGTILPGHGVFLDRYDSFLFVLPVAALGYFIFAP
jgi:phosphatidate cytidylyltransferase